MRKVINHGMDIAGGRGIHLVTSLPLPIKPSRLQLQCKHFNPLTHDLWSGFNALYLFEELQLLQSDDKANAVSMTCYLNT